MNGPTVEEQRNHPIKDVGSQEIPYMLYRPYTIQTRKARQDVNIVVTIHMDQVLR
jgi:hypothetical protein